MVPKQDTDGDGLYVRLEVPPGASQDDVARAYRRLAHDAHPDAHPGDPDAPRRFREITEAYEVLGDPARRERYDRARDQARVAMSIQASRVPAGGPSAAAPVLAPPPAAGGPPVFLGTGPVIAPGPLLSVGPVHVLPSGTGPTMSVTPEDLKALWAQLLSDMFEPRQGP